MIYPSIDVLLTKVDSKYKLVHLVTKRSRELAEKKNYQMPEKKYKSSKDIGRALEEIAEEYVTVKPVAEEE